jgi:hypothetical protein
MTNFTINDFWKKRLNVKPVEGAGLTEGWSVIKSGLSTFVEAPLMPSTVIESHSNPEDNSLLLVSAPGAVGKSTLARQIAAVTGAVYVNLAEAAPVGGNTLSGGLVRSGLYDGWKAGTAAVLLDGLDEARLLVTQNAFEAFLTDVAEISRGRAIPTVLFGRSGAAQDAWLILALKNIDVPVLEIGYFGAEAASNFTETLLRSLKPDSPHTLPERTAIDLLLGRLREQTENDGDRFAGYAPVLQAVANRVASERNPSTLIADIEKGGQIVTLQTIVAAILDRERGKLTPLQFQDSAIAEVLYSKDEQLARLAARVYSLPPPNLPKMTAKDAETYTTALETWVPDHPFLEGNVNPSSSVFQAAIATWALETPGFSATALDRELRRGAAANPFLSEFYLPNDTPKHAVPPEYIGIIYSSLRARLSLGDTASLLVEGDEDAIDEEALRAEVEISFARREMDRPRFINFLTEQTGTIRLGSHIEDADITVPYSEVEIGPGSEAILVAPINIQAKGLSVTTDKLIIENPNDSANEAVYLEAQYFSGPQIGAIPTLRGSVSLAVSWPNAKAHPWTTFAVDPPQVENPKLDEALRRFRKFVISFRSHSKGSLARYKHKIEHERMIKGSGKAVLELLLQTKIVSLNNQQNMYYLDPNQLANIAGASYADTMARKFKQKTIDFIRRSIE